MSNFWQIAVSILEKNAVPYSGNTSKRERDKWDRKTKLHSPLKGSAAMEFYFRVIIGTTFTKRPFYEERKMRQVTYIDLVVDSWKGNSWLSYKAVEYAKAKMHL